MGLKTLSRLPFDNGSEFAKLSTIKGSEIYFSHPYSPEESGTNENQNGLIREFKSKGHSLNDYDLTLIQAVQDALNDRLRRLLDYQMRSGLMLDL